MFLVKLGTHGDMDVWYCKCSTDPRTFNKNAAQVFNSLKEANSALIKARKIRPFEKAEIVEERHCDPSQ